MNAKAMFGMSAAALAGYWMGRTLRPGVAWSSDRVPGRSKSARSRALELGAAMLQARSPAEAMNVYLDGFHPFVGDINHQMEAHHFCTPINEDFIQCAIFDGNTSDARLIGVEYVISERLFLTLPEEERRLWHSHHHEVKSGQLIAPGVPEVAEHELMKKLIHTYGKTWHTWDTHRHELPVGEPMLMVAFTEDGQIHPELVADRDRRFGISTEQRRRDREDIAVPPLVPGVHTWEPSPAPH